MIMREKRRREGDEDATDGENWKRKEKRGFKSSDLR